MRECFLYVQLRVQELEADSKVQAAINKIQTACGLEEQTMEYLRRYEYGDDLLRKLAAGMK